MKWTHKLGLAALLGGMVAVGFGFGYVFHMRTLLEKFAKETDREASYYQWTLLWRDRPGAILPVATVIGTPDPEFPSSRAGRGKWKWYPQGATEPCDADEHRVIWRWGKDRWELLVDLETDESLEIYPDPDAPPAG